MFKEVTNLISKIKNKDENSEGISRFAKYEGKFENKEKVFTYIKDKLTEFFSKNDNFLKDDILIKFPDMLLDKKVKLMSKMKELKEEVSDLDTFHSLDIYNNLKFDYKKEESNPGDLSYLFFKLSKYIDILEESIDKGEYIEKIEKKNNQLNIDYSFKNKETGKVEYKESINLDIEQKLKEFIDFYKETNINLPIDFKEQIKEIWEDNIDDIQKAIEENGFDDILLMPASIPLQELNDKMTEGYCATHKGVSFELGGGFQGAKSNNIDKVRIVLVHRTQNLKDRPELAKTLNIKGEDAIKSEILTSEDYWVFQRKYFKETGKHLDEIGGTWLATYLGARLVSVDWYLSEGRILVDADGLDYQSGFLGDRPSRSFFKKGSL